jgi:hypothetical protein
MHWLIWYGMTSLTSFYPKRYNVSYFLLFLYFYINLNSHYSRLSQPYFPKNLISVKFSSLVSSIILFLFKPVKIFSLKMFQFFLNILETLSVILVDSIVLLFESLSRKPATYVEQNKLFTLLQFTLRYGRGILQREN